MAQRNGSYDRTSAFIFIVSLMVFAICSVFQYGAGTDNFEWLWLIILFGFPLGIQLFCWLALEVLKERDEKNNDLHTFCHFFVWTMLLNITFYCILWMLYLGGNKGNAYSAMAMFFIILTAGIVLMVTYVIMRQPADADATREESAGAARSRAEWFQAWHMSYLPRLKRGLEQKPFWALLHFFAMFLGVAYLFGFAFAFHDQGRVKLEDGKPVYSDLPPLYNEALSFRGESERSVKIRDKNDDLKKCFYFPTLRAELELEQPPPYNQLPPEVTAEMQRKWHNFNELDSLLTHIKKGRVDRLVRITLVGRASAEPITLPDRRKKSSLVEGDNLTYLSNYELSQARTQAVRYEVLGKLIEAGYERWRNIDWMSIPLSNEQSSRSSIGCPHLGGMGSELTDNNKIVKVFVEAIPNDAATGQLGQFYEREVKPLDLLGYMYFSIYTITTTGYGDIMPTSGYARFLATLANIFEVFFIVGFLNTLISLKKA